MDIISSDKSTHQNWFATSTTFLTGHSTPSPAPHKHHPKADETCATFERVVDEQIEGLLEILRFQANRPCPSCGHVRPETDPEAGWDA